MKQNCDFVYKDLYNIQIFNPMSAKRFKPEKLQIFETTVHEMDDEDHQGNDAVNSSGSNSQSFNYISLTSHWERLQNSETSTSSSSSYSSGSSETNLQQQNALNNLVRTQLFW